MRRRRFFFVFVFVFVLAFSFTFSAHDSLGHSHSQSSSSSGGILIALSDFQALVAVKRSFFDSSGKSLRSWNESDQSSACASWFGVKCAQGGQIVALQLPSKGLEGGLAPEIGQLFALRKLNLHSNSIAGAIPSSLAFLRNLRGLYLFRNQFSGAIPPDLFSTIALPSLQAVDLSHNQLSGGIPPPALNSSTRIWRLDLSYNKLSGGIPSSLGGLTALRDLRLANNSLEGPLPSSFGDLHQLLTLDLSRNSLNGSISILPSLLFLNLSRNRFSGSIPSDIDGIKQLIVLDLSGNALSGEFPPYLANIVSLSTLDLSKNSLSGAIPLSIATLANLTTFNCSENRLTGPVPPLLARKFNESSFLGNPGLCNFSSSSPCPPVFSSPPSQSPSSHPVLIEKANQKFGKLSFILIILGAIVVAALIICLVLVLLWRCFCLRQAGDKKSRGGDHSRSSSGKEGSGGGGGAAVVGGKLVHFEGSVGFTADDLLCATAEVLGKSSYGTVYKASLEDGQQLAVKRLREGIVRGQREFEAEVGILGALRHPCLVSLRAYYWGPKDEKLLIHDFMPAGSLAAFLHARGPDIPMDWHIRFGIVNGIAQGLAYLHQTHKIVHGNLTSTNILLDGEMNARLSDFGLSRLMTAAANTTIMAAVGALGYRAPELTKIRKASFKSDVYSFGVVLLELLTGRAPGEASAVEIGMDLPEWVASTIKEEWTNEIFDVELMKGVEPAIDDDLINALQLAMSCVSLSPGSRPDMGEVVRALQELENKPQLPSIS